MHIVLGAVVVTRRSCPPQVPEALCHCKRVLGYEHVLLGAFMVTHLEQVSHPEVSRSCSCLPAKASARLGRWQKEAAGIGEQHHP